MESVVFISSECVLLCEVYDACVCDVDVCSMQIFTTITICIYKVQGVHKSQGYWYTYLRRSIFACICVFFFFFFAILAKVIRPSFCVYIYLIKIYSSVDSKNNVNPLCPLDKEISVVWLFEYECSAKSLKFCFLKLPLTQAPVIGSHVPPEQWSQLAGSRAANKKSNLCGCRSVWSDDW